MLLATTDAAMTTMRNVFELAVPEAVLLAVACAVFLGGTVKAGRHLWASVSLLGLGLAFWLFWTREPSAQLSAVDTALLPDALADFVRVTAYAGSAVMMLMFWGEVRDEQAADFFACTLLLTAGLSLVGAANDLIVLFLALELISIPTYILLYLPRTTARSQEATIKYFLLSIFSSGLLLFGFSYLFGTHGTTNLTAFFKAQAAQTEAGTGLLVVAFVTIVAGIGFRVTAVPFHFYAPDVFQGAPTTVASMLAFVPKVAGFTALVRLMGLLHGDEVGLIADSQVALLFWLLAVITMTVGNILALLQDNLKRMLAYSSIAHGGYMLIGLAAAPHLRGTGPRGMLGTDGVMFYLVAYGAMTLGAFAVLHYLKTDDREPETVDDLAGLGRSQPLIALVFAVFLFSLIGLPLTAGFSGKFLLFFSALEADSHLTEQRGLFIALTVIGAINAAIAAYYYLRLIATMYLRDGIRPWIVKPRIPAAVALGLCLALTILLGIYPTPIVQAIRNSVAGDAIGPPIEKKTAMR